jgi:hypothetical protein
MNREGNFHYDVFVSYRWVTPDQEWVRNQLVPALKQAGLSVCLDVEDFVPGRDLILEMSRAGTESRQAICVLSPDYFDGNRMVGFESLMARRFDPSGGESKLIPLVIRKTEVPEFIRGLVPIDWTSPENHMREWRKLLKVLGGTKHDASAPSALEEVSKKQQAITSAERLEAMTRVVLELQQAYENFQKAIDGSDQVVITGRFCDELNAISLEGCPSDFYNLFERAFNPDYS